MNQESQNLVAKAKRSLAAAKRLSDAGDHDFAAARAYYAMFYVAEAALLEKGLSFSNHSAVISQFFEQFVKSGVVTKELHKSLHRAFLLRQEGDYMSVPNISAKTVEKLIEDTKTFLKEVAAMLK